MTETKQYFATEDYPHYYKENQDCHFSFQAPPGRRIVVFFEDFHLSDVYDDDYLHFRKSYTMDTKNNYFEINILTRPDCSINGLGEPTKSARAGLDSCQC